MTYRYLIALGSNQPHHRHGSPRKVLVAALQQLSRKPVTLLSAAPIIESAPLGPSRRRYANSAALVKTRLSPEQLLGQLQHIEDTFGRRRSGQSWGPRVLDLDIVLWSEGAFASPDLIIPHPEFRSRSFVLTPALALAPGWRDPITGLKLRHLHFRLTRRLTTPHRLP